MTRRQYRIANALVLRTTIATVAASVTFLAIWVALDAFEYLDRSMVLAIIVAGLIVDRLASTLTAPKARKTA